MKGARVDVADLFEKRPNLVCRDGDRRFRHELLAEVPPGLVDEPRGPGAFPRVDGKTPVGKDIQKGPVRVRHIRHDGCPHAQPLKGQPPVGDDTPQPLRDGPVLDDPVDRDGADDEDLGVIFGTDRLHAVRLCPTYNAEGKRV